MLLHSCGSVSFCTYEETEINNLQTGEICYVTACSYCKKKNFKKNLRYCCTNGYI